MNRTIFCVSLFIIAVMLIACDQPVQRPVRAETRGVTISDLEPAYKPEMPSEIHFRIYTFILSEQMLADSDNIFAIVDKEPLQFVSEEAFKANGFAAGYAKGDSWDELGKRLKQADAVGVKETAMIIYDDMGNDLNFATLNRRVSIDYFTSAHDSSKINISPGKLAWRIIAAPIDNKSATAEVRIATISKPDIPKSVDPFIENRKPKAVIFEASSFELEMSPGDFLVMGPEKYDPEIDMETLNLTASGEFELLDSDPNDLIDAHPGKLTLGKLLFKVQGRPLARFFVVVCVRTGN